MGTHTGKIIRSLVAVLGLAMAGITHAEPTYWVDSSGDPISTGYGGCWSAVHGSIGVCNDSDGDGVDDANDDCPGTPKGVEVDATGCPLDSDGDGVTDDKDRCPNTETGVAVDAEGCPLDSDGDGVIDSRDRCPGTPAGVVVDARGCPQDTDGDGVTDDRDRCPGTPRGAKVDAEGCTVHMRIESPHFGFDKAQLDSRARSRLDDVVKVVNSDPRIRRVVVTGHTDSVGPEGYNQKLSERRAQAVKRYLVSQGVSADMVVTRGRGESSPVADNDTEAGRSRNRRAEVDFER